MKKLFLVMFVGMAALTFAAPQAHAVPMFKDGFLEKYAEADATFVATAKKAGCNLCHVPKEKKTARNAFGMALSKHIKKEDGKGTWKKADEAKKKQVLDAIEAASKEKAADGSTFASKIEAGQLPGEE